MLVVFIIFRLHMMNYLTFKNLTMKTFKLIISVFIISAFVSCKYEQPEEPAVAPPSAGDVNFSKFISIGDGNTSGFMHAALYAEGQQNSFPKLLSLKVMEAVDVTFNQPLLSTTSPNGFNPVYSQPGIGLLFGRLEMIQPSCPQSSITARPTLGGALTPYTGNKSELNNLGVTGLKMVEITVSGYGILNSFFGRFALDPTTSSVLSDAAAKQPTFFTIWLGNQDVLGYAVAGGTGMVDGVQQYDLTPDLLFAASLNAALNTLIPAGSNVKAVVGNIPDILTLPFFYTVNNSLLSSQKLPFNLSAAEAGGLLQLYSLMGWGNPNFTAGAVNYFTIETDSGIRQMNPTKDYLLLSLSTDSLGSGPIDPCDPLGAQRAGWGITKPIPDVFVLDETEVANVRAKIDAYNNAIKTETDARANVALADMNALLHQLNTTGVIAGNGIIKTSLPFGGAISLDGLHPTPKGAAVYANKFIETINEAFNANIYKLDPIRYKGIEIP